jgi:site-specific DNA recombinase
VERQLASCKAICDRHGWVIVETFSDNDLSASRQSRKPRPDYQRMLRMARDRQADVVVAYSTSRLTRRPREFEDLIDLAESGMKIVTDRSGDLNLNTARGRRRARDDAARDAEYAEEISELAKAEREQRRQQGRWHGGNRPFGWDRDGMTPRPAEQALIRSACQQVLAGRSLGAIARDWSSALGRLVRPNAVGDILRNPRVAGRLPDDRPARWSPVVDEATWRGVAAVLADPARHKGRGPSRLLTGIATCGLCRGTVNGGVTRTGAPTYRCAAGRHLDRLAAPVDDYVSEVLLVYLARQRLTVSPGVDTAALACDAAALRARLDEAADLFSAGAITGAQLARSTAALRTQLEAAEVAMTVAVGASALAGLPLDEDELRAVWDAVADDVERRRAILRASGLSVTVYPPGRGARTFDPETVEIR